MVKKPEKSQAAERTERERRLAEALRENLRRRKEQARTKAAAKDKSGRGPGSG